MYWTPWARLMKSITPKMRVSPAAIRNRMSPNCRPLRAWTKNRVVVMDVGGPDHRTEESGAGETVRARPGRAVGRCPKRGGQRPIGLPLVRGGAILGIGVGVIVEHLLDDLRLELAVRPFGGFHQVEVLDREAVRTELEVAAQGLEIRFLEGGAQSILVLGLAAGRLESAVDQLRRVVAVHRIGAWHGAVGRLIGRDELLVLRRVEVRRPVGAS